MKTSTFFQKIPIRRTGLVFLVLISSLIACKSQNDKIHILSGTEGSTYEQIGQRISASSELADTPHISNDNSKGSIDNLQQLLNHKTDFALIQLDVASDAMKKGQIQAVAVLANEYLHVIVRKDSHIQNFLDLKGKKVADGQIGSGTQYTATSFFKASNIHVDEKPANLKESFDKLLSKKVDAVFYVGPAGTNQVIKKYLTENSELQILPLQSSLINYMTVQFPESYQSATIPAGTYSVLPVQPSSDVTTVVTPTALVTRPDVDKSQVNLTAWAILATSRQYTPFYPQLSVGEAKVLMRKGLFYIHPGAQLAFEQGDPRIAWLSYLQENKPLQAATIMFSMTSLIGYLIRRWRKQRSAELIKSTRKTINELRTTLVENPQKTLDNIEELRQQHRFKLIDGAISSEIYEQIERMTQILAEECRKLRDQQHEKSVQNTLILLDDWQNKFKLDPIAAEEQLHLAEANYRQMLLSGQVDIQTYILIKQLIKK